MGSLCRRRDLASLRRSWYSIANSDSRAAASPALTRWSSSVISLTGLRRSQGPEQRVRPRRGAPHGGTPAGTPRSIPPMRRSPQREDERLVRSASPAAFIRRRHLVRHAATGAVLTRPLREHCKHADAEVSSGQELGGRTRSAEFLSARSVTQHRPTTGKTTPASGTCANASFGSSHYQRRGERGIRSGST